MAPVAECLPGNPKALSSKNSLLYQLTQAAVIDATAWGSEAKEMPEAEIQGQGDNAVGFCVVRLGSQLL
jgi:hypothetical protein